MKKKILAVSPISFPEYNTLHVLFQSFNSYEQSAGNFMVIEHSPYIAPIYTLLEYSSFHFLFHDPYIAPIYTLVEYSSFHFIFHHPYTASGPHGSVERRRQTPLARASFSVRFRVSRAFRGGYWKVSSSTFHIIFHYPYTTPNIYTIKM